MTKTRIILLIACLVVFAAGLVVGRVAVDGPRGDERPESVMARELGLTDQQRDQMRAIWEGMRALGKQNRDARMEARKKRDEAEKGLLTSEQLAAYEQIEKDYQQESDRIDAARNQAFKDAHEQTRALLTEEQREKFDKMMRDRFRSGGPGGGPGGSGRRGPDGGSPGDRGGHSGPDDRHAPPPPDGDGRVKP